MNLNFRFLKDFINVHSPGYVIEIFYQGKCFEYVFGNKSVLPKEEITTFDTLYDIASLTKTFTAVLVYMAYEEGLLDLEQTVYSLDAYFKNLKEVKVLDLLCHNQEIYTKGYLGDAKEKSEFLKILYSAYVKSNIPYYIDADYIILGILLERIYQKSFDQLVKEKICEPLNLKSVTFKPDKTRCASCNYEYKNAALITTNDVGVVHDKKAKTAFMLGIYTGHAGLFSTGGDLLKFLISFLDYSLLRKETIHKMLEHYDVDEFNYNYLKDITGKNEDINTLFEIAMKDDPSLHVPFTYNFMGARYRNKIKEKNDVDELLSNSAITFSGFTGPMYQIDFEKKLIVLVMCNVLHNSRLPRPERKKYTEKIIHEILKQIS